jgi:hypothetical protein
MNEIFLITKKGESVGRFDIPDFPYGQPKVLIWGERVFLQDDDDPDNDEYREVFGFPIRSDQLPKPEED